MEILEKIENKSYAIKFSINKDGLEVGRSRLYLIYNDLHKEPYGLLEDVFVLEQYRALGYGKKLVEAVIEKARELGCTKLVGQSRYGRDKVHKLYENLGFKDYGKNFRIDFI